MANRELFDDGSYVERVANGERQTPEAVEGLISQSQELPSLHQRVSKKASDKVFEDGGTAQEAQTAGRDAMARLHGFKDHAEMSELAKMAINRGHLTMEGSTGATSYAHVAAGITRMLRSEYNPRVATAKLRPQRGEADTGPWSASESYDPVRAAQTGHRAIRLDQPGVFMKQDSEGGRAIADLPVSDIKEIVKGWSGVNEDRKKFMVDEYHRTHAAAKTSIEAAKAAKIESDKALMTFTAAQAAHTAATSSLKEIADTHEKERAVRGTVSVPTMMAYDSARELHKNTLLQLNKSRAASQVAGFKLKDASSVAKAAISAHHDIIDQGRAMYQRDLTAGGIPVSGGDLAAMGDRRIERNTATMDEYHRHSNKNPASMLYPGTHRVVPGE